MASQSISSRVPSFICSLKLFFLSLFKNNGVYVFIFGSAGSSLQHRLFPSCGERGLLSSCGVQGFSLRWRLLVWSMRSRARGLPCGLRSCSSQALEHRLNSCGAWAFLPHSMWDFPGPGTKPVSPARAGRLLTPEPPGSPLSSLLLFLQE